jgi:hypothetical protein
VSRAEHARRVAVVAGLAAWLTATAACQHPSRVFHGLRRHDPLGLVLPTWRFFAPEPGRHDYLLAWRAIGTDGGEGSWRPAAPVLARRPLHTVWFPARRREKALLDACAGLLSGRGMRGFDIETSPSYRLLRACAARALAEERLDVTAFRFGVQRSAGRDPVEKPVWVFVSPICNMTSTNQRHRKT